MGSDAVAVAEPAAVSAARTGGSSSHVPALDGLRGAAVAGVLLYHAGHLEGGYLGVDLFFVLSGFLITSLLLAEHARHGRIALGAFWARRLRRLLPALLLLLVGVAAYAVVLARPIDLPGIRGDALATLGYVANWRTILGGSSYWDISLAPSPLQHAWSLAIEEQFYVVWPLAFALLVRRARDHLSLTTAVLRVAVVGAVASAALLVGLHAAGASDTRVYQGTDTRAAAILLGVALAAWRARRAALAPGEPSHRPAIPLGPPSTQRSNLVAAAGLAALAAMWVGLDGRSTTLYRGGLAAASLLGLFAIATASRPGSSAARLLSVAPLRALGAISYGLYLWHWPIYQAIDQRNGRLPGLGDLRLEGAGLLAAKVGASLAAALVSYVVVEQPIRRGRLPSRWAPPIALAGAAAAGLLVVVATAGGRSADRIEAQPARAATTVADAPTVVVAGDSVALSVASRLYADPARYGVNPLDRTRIGCSIAYVGHPVRSFAGDPIEPPPCERYALRDVDEVRPDLVYLHIGSRPNDSMQVDGEWVRACDPAYDRTYRDATVRFLRKVRARGSEVVVGTILHSGANTFPVEGSEERIDCINRVIRRLPDLVEGVHVVDGNELLCPSGGECREELDGEPVRTDGLHLDRGPGGDLVVDWIFDRAFEQVDVRRPAPAGGRPTG